MFERRPRYPSIPQATLDPLAMLATLEAIREVVEVLSAQRGEPGRSPDERIEALQREVANLRARVTALGG